MVGFWSSDLHELNSWLCDFIHMDLLCWNRGPVLGPLILGPGAPGLWCERRQGGLCGQRGSQELCRLVSGGKKTGVSLGETIWYKAIGGDHINMDCLIAVVWCCFCWDLAWWSEAFLLQTLPPLVESCSRCTKHSNLIINKIIKTYLSHHHGKKTTTMAPQHFYHAAVGVRLVADPRRARGATDPGAAEAAGHDGTGWNPSPGR